MDSMKIKNYIYTIKVEIIEHFVQSIIKNIYYHLQNNIFQKQLFILR